MSDTHGERRAAGARRPAGPGLSNAVAARRRALVVSGLRDRARDSRDGVPEPTALEATGALEGVERCDICKTTIPSDHRHLLQLHERRIECVCESCWALRSGDAEYRPTGSRTLWLSELELPDDLWASFQIPIGLAFFIESTTAGCVVALYPSPAGATESELHFTSWSRMVQLNPILAGLEADVEGLIVNRLSDPPVQVIAPIDRCYALTGIVKASWEGISGGGAVEDAVSGFFDQLRAEATAT